MWATRASCPRRLLDRRTFPGIASFPSLYFGDLSGYGVTLGPDPNAPQETIQNLYDMVDNITWVKGHHTFNMGAEGRKFIEPEIFTQRNPRRL